MAGKQFDAAVVGSGPNGLAAAILLQRAGLAVKIFEARDTVGGGMRSGELTRPGFLHDICSAIHPLAAASPVFRHLPLAEHGLRWIDAPFALAHPYDDGTAAVLPRSLQAAADRLGSDGESYQRLFEPIVHEWKSLTKDILGPARFPRHPLVTARFGWKALRSAEGLARSWFQGRDARGLFAGIAAHSMQPLNAPASAAIGLVLGALAHVRGWPMPAGGSQRLADALAAYFLSLGGEIETGRLVRNLEELPTARCVFLDLTPRQFLAMAGPRLSWFYRRQLSRYQYGPGVFKMDWALDGPVPFTASDCRQAGTVHLGGTSDEVAEAESGLGKGQTPRRPFIIFAQPSVFDPSRAPEGKHTAWAYCHVPNGSACDMTEAIEAQVERFAPGFRDRILERHSMNTVQMEDYNPNYIGGDINGGSQNLRQILARPALRPSPYSTSISGVYLCSSSTPPGGGVHGMCGFHAARHALKRHFGIRLASRAEA